jgi:hypothetical protein
VSEFPESYQGMKGMMLAVLGESYILKDKITSLNREVASRNAEIAKLKNQIAAMKKAGDYNESEELQVLTDLLEEKYPRDRLTYQRKEIARLHRVIRELKSQ